MQEHYKYIVNSHLLPKFGDVQLRLPEKTVLTPEQLSSLLEKLPEPFRSLVWLLVLTGLRIDELLALRWQDIDLQAGLLRVSRTLLASARPGTPKPDALVFCSKKGTPLCRRNLRNRQLDPVCEELKIPKIGWHSLRHSNATLLDAVGTPLGTVQSLLGHPSPEITRGTYIHSLPSGAKEAVQKVENLLTGPKRTQIVEIHKMASSLIQ
jgi:integrase